MDKMRWRYGDTNRVDARVDAATRIERGDLLAVTADGVWPAADQAIPVGGSRPVWQLAQEEFVRRFLGVAMQSSREGEDDPIRVATTGVFEFQCRAGRRDWELGDLVGPCQSAELGRLFSQTVCRVDEAELAVARVAEIARPDAVSILVEIRSTIMYGGVYQRPRRYEVAPAPASEP